MSDSGSTSISDDVVVDHIPLIQPALSPRDDWSGLADAAERRKRQNRINQRARRLRQQSDSTRWNKDMSKGAIDVYRGATYAFHVGSELQAPSTGLTYTDISRVGESTHHNEQQHSLVSSYHTPFEALSALITALSVRHPSDRIRTAVLRQIELFYRSYKGGSPQCDHLLSLTRMNVHRAFISNMLLMGIDWEWMADDAISPCTMERPGFDPDALPVTLRPTYLQRTRNHHTWIDLFPLPLMRDNLLRAGDDWDDEDLCTDLMGFWEGSGTGPAGLMLWGEPSDPFNWEVTEGFLKKWGWIVNGCFELMLATNSWRASRGERPLFRLTN